MNYNSYFELLTTQNWDKIKVVILCGLPGSGKSTLGETLKTKDFLYLSSDIARVETLKLTVGKFSTNSEYVKNTEQVYTYMRKELEKTIKQKGQITLDATHLNEQRAKTLAACQKLGLAKEEVLVVYVDGGKRENVRDRFLKKPGRNQDGRSWEEAWAEAYDYFLDKIEKGEVVIPKKSEKGYPVVWVKNY